MAFKGYLDWSSKKKYVLPTKLPAQRRNTLEAIVCEDSGLGRFCLYNTKKSIGFLGLVMKLLGRNVSLFKQLKKTFLSVALVGFPLLSFRVPDT